MNSHQALDSLNLQRVISLWLGFFAIWFVCESCTRILLQHPDWTVGESIKYLGINLIYGIAWGLFLGTANLLILKCCSKLERIGNRISALLIPQEAVVVSALVAVPLLYTYRNHLNRISTTTLFRWETGVIIFALIYTVFLLAAKRFPKWLNQLHTPFRLRNFAVLFLLPLFATLAIQFLRDQKLSETPKGPIRYVVLISIDTLRYDYVGVYGIQNVHTPVMDRIASEGALFVMTGRKMT